MADDAAVGTGRVYAIGTMSPDGFRISRVTDESAF